MVWAIDLDDGTLINALGSNLGRKKFTVFNSSIPLCMMGNWEKKTRKRGFGSVVYAKTILASLSN